MAAKEALNAYADSLLNVPAPRIKDDALAAHAVKRARRYLSDFAADMRTNFK